MPRAVLPNFRKTQTQGVASVYGKGGFPLLKRPTVPFLLPLKRGSDTLEAVAHPEVPSLSLVSYVSFVPVSSCTLLHRASLSVSGVSFLLKDIHFPLKGSSAGSRLNAAETSCGGIHQGSAHSVHKRQDTVQGLQSIWSLFQLTHPASVMKITIDDSQMNGAVFPCRNIYRNGQQARCEPGAVVANPWHSA